jgi:hypothetical protein
MKSLLFSAAMITLVSPAWAQDTMTTATPEALTWKDNPAIPKGGQLAILVGDPTKAGGAGLSDFTPGDRLSKKLLHG